MEKNLNELNRKDFLHLSAKAGLATAVGAGVLGSFLSSCSGSKSVSIGKNIMTGFAQDPLPYAYNALEPVIDEKTMNIHYTKHAAGYTTKLKEAIASETKGTATSVEEILRSISKYSATMRNNAGGHYNHELFWKTMRKPSDINAPDGQIKSAIEKSFGSVEAFITQFEEAANGRFGSGWAWLYIKNNKDLAIGSTANQDNPLMNVNAFQGLPLLGLDVWEHAYYLKYQNKRKDYVKTWWKTVNWKFVNERFSKI